MFLNEYGFLSDCMTDTFLKCGKEIWIMKLISSTNPKNGSTEWMKLYWNWLDVIVCFVLQYRRVFTVGWNFPAAKPTHQLISFPCLWKKKMRPTKHWNYHRKLFLSNEIIEVKNKNWLALTKAFGQNWISNQNEWIDEWWTHIQENSNPKQAWRQSYLSPYWKTVFLYSYFIKVGVYYSDSRCKTDAGQTAKRGDIYSKTESEFGTILAVNIEFGLHLIRWAIANGIANKQIITKNEQIKILLACKIHYTILDKF